MIHYQDATITGLFVHRVGNQTEGEILMLTETSVNVKRQELQDIVKRYIGNPFSSPEYFVFDEHAVHPLWKAAKAIFSKPASLHEQSKAIAQHHYETAIDISIDAGDLMIAHLKDVKVDGELTDAVAICKIENREDFILLNEEDDHYTLDILAGLNVNKPDKGCLILNLKEEEGFRVCQVDKGLRFGASGYWKEDFLKVKPAVDSYHDTKNFMELTRSFVAERMSEEFEVDRADQADLLNRSIHYLKQNDKLDEENFGATVFGDPGVVESFKDYKNHYQQEFAVEIPQDFSISDQAVKKQARIFKSVLKLDKNFHIYIHGNRNMIQKGEDEGGRKYYKIFYNQEL
ncbi:MAG: nucleoid-associated protein [Flavobacteriales bacterium]|nr:nucleoid-associated protein [Flavobacteriales bacterium]